MDVEKDVGQVSPVEDPAPEVVGPVPDHAHAIVVPVANPRTAGELLTLARAMVRADGGRIIAVVIVLGDADAEQNIERVEALQEVVDGIFDEDDDIDMDLLTRPAISIARGILDAAQDEGADMILLGVQAPVPGDVAVGRVAESVVDAAQCDVLIYRRARHGGGLDKIERIVATVDGTPEARVGVRLSLILGQGFGKPVEVLHVRRPGETPAESDRIVDRALNGIDDADACTRAVVNASSVPRGLRSAIGPKDLAVVGFDAIVRFDGKVMGRTSTAAMDSLSGPVIAVSRPSRTPGRAALLRRLARRLRPRLTTVEEESLIWQARLHATLTADFVVLCILSSLIATFGLLLNSAAVIIGAMLVAPLMSPLIAFGTTLVDGDVITLRRAGITTVVGTVLVAGAALIVGVIVGADSPTPEMTSRGSPSLIDAGVAVASGMVGAYASARKGIPAALAGVAIAAALVPPICVFGLALPTDGRLAAGAGLLFVTNIACMAVASAAVLLWLGLRVDRASSQTRGRYVRASVLFMVVVLGALVLFGLANQGRDLDGIGRVVGEALVGAEVIDVDDSGPSGVVTVTVRAVEDPPGSQISEAARLVEEAHPDLILRLVVLRLLTGS